MSVRRFPCTPGGAVLRGRLRLRKLLVGLALLMIVVAVAAWIGGQRWPAVFALLVAAVPWTAWRMSGDLDLLWLDAGNGYLVIQMRRRRERFPVSGAEARRLTPEEIEHLERLATSGGVTAGTGGFDSRLLGEIDLYASDLSNSVLVEVGENRLIVTPDDPEGLLQALGAGPGGQ
jgi:Bacterial PH domain